MPAWKKRATAMRERSEYARGGRTAAQNRVSNSLGFTAEAALPSQNNEGRDLTAMMYGGGGGTTTTGGLFGLGAVAEVDEGKADGGGLFDDEDQFDLPKQGERPTAMQQPPRQSKGMFGGDSDSDDDYGKNRNQGAKPSILQSKRPGAFDDSDEDDDFVPAVKKAEPKPTAAKKPAMLDSDSDDDTFKPVKKATEVQKTQANMMAQAAA